MRLVSCSKCHTQYDVTSVKTAAVDCVCGEQIVNTPLRAVDATVERCASCGAAVEERSARCGYCQSPIARDARDLSLICPECFARNRDNARFCTHCGVEFAPQVALLPGETLDCPACESTMVARLVGDVQVHECLACQGVWAPGESFDAIVQKAVIIRAKDPAAGLPGSAPEAERREADWKVRYRKCPVCGGHMQRKNYGQRSGIIVDWCGEDGTWLDADELGAIAAFVMAGGLERTGTAGPLGSGPRNAAEARALVQAERIMAGEKMAQERRRNRMQARGGSTRSPILELFEAIFRG